MTAPAFGILNFFSNTTWQIPFTIEKNGSALSLAGATIVAKLRDQVDDTSALASWSCSVVDGPNGEGLCVLSAATTGALTYDASATDEWKATLFFADILITLSDGTTIGPVRFKVYARRAVSR